MGNKYYFLPTSGTASWNTGANWLKDDDTTGTVPGGTTGDSAFIMQGNADISTGLVAPTNALALLVFGGTFSGTLGTTGNTSDSMPMNATTFTVNCAATRIKLDFSTNNYIGYVTATGDSADTGLEAVRIRGGNTASKLAVSGGSAGLATTRPGITATLAEFDISNGTLNLGAGVTCITGKQSGGTLAIGCGLTTFTQTGGDVSTNGSGTITTFTVGSNATINHRAPAGTDTITTLTVDPDSTCDFSQNPQALQISNPILAYKNATINAFSPIQITRSGGTAMQIRYQQCGPDDVIVSLGRQVLATYDAG